MPQMTATVEPLVRLGGAIHLTARRSDGCTIQVMLGRDGTRGHVARSVTSEDGLPWAKVEEITDLYLLTGLSVADISRRARVPADAVEAVLKFRGVLAGS